MNRPIIDSSTSLLRWHPGQVVVCDMVSISLVKEFGGEELAQDRIPVFAFWLEPVNFIWLIQHNDVYNSLIILTIPISLALS